MNKTFLSAVFGAALMVVGVPAAQAATITIESMQYSASHPVPHIHYEGETVAGDVEALKAVYDTYVHCRLECIGSDGGATAVLTMKGPGGNYHTGLKLADFLRANHIATVVQRDAKCYSACAFAFLGGTGYSSFDRVGTYVDRMIEPGSTVGFHAPYRDDASLRQALVDRAPSSILGESRDSLSLMVRELVKWNVDPEIVFYMLEMGPDETYDLKAADDLYLVRTALPPTPTSAWITTIPEAVRNACIRLLALYERTDPLLLKDRIDTPYEQPIGTNKTFGSLSGYRLGNELLDLGHCSVTDASVAAGYNLQISLYLNPGIEGSSEPLMTFFNNEDFISTAGIGGNPLKRVFQKGGLNHWFLPIGVDIDSLNLPGEFAITADRFFTIGQPKLAAAYDGLGVVRETANTRVSKAGDVWVFEQTGSAALYEAALAATAGVTLSVDKVGGASFVREGTYADGTAFEVIGFVEGNSALVVRSIYANAAGSAPTTEQRALVGALECAARLGALKLSCS